MRKTPSEAYLEKARHLSKEETERLLSRMREKLTRRLEDKKLSAMEVVAIQLEIEDEALSEWLERMQEIMNKTKSIKPVHRSIPCWRRTTGICVDAPWPTYSCCLRKHGQGVFPPLYTVNNHDGSYRDQTISTGTESTLVYSP